MSYSEYALNCRQCEKINEPIDKTRQHDGSVKASYRCDCGSTFQQKFNLNFEVPKLEPPEEKEEKQKPPAPEGNVMEWTEEDRDSFVKWYGISEYKNLVSKAVKNDGHAEYQAPEDEPAMPTDPDPRNWSSSQRDTWINRWGRDKYVERILNAYKSEKEPVMD